MNLAPARYHRAAIAMHWLLAVLLAFQFALGLRLETVAGLADKFNAFQLHKSVGILILLFSLARLALRYTLPRPPAADGGIKGLAAKLTHGLFYAVMIGGPLTGWALVSTAKVKVPTVLFGVVPWPHLPLGSAANGPAELGHMVLAWLLPVLIALHLGGVAWHWLQKDGVPARMLPVSLAQTPALAAGLALLGLGAVAGAVLTPPNLWHGITAKSAAPAPVAASEPAPLPDEPIATDEASPSESPTPSPTASESEAAVSADWRVLPGSRLGFSTSYGGSAINGSFGSWKANIRFDPADLPRARIQATIALSSARSGDAERDSTLKGPGFFDVGANPTASFTANGFQQLGKDRYSATGTLNLNGISRPVKLVFTLRVSGDSATAQGTAQLSRLAFRVGQDEWESTDQIPDAVGVSFNIKAERK